MGGGGEDGRGRGCEVREERREGVVQRGKGREGSGKAQRCINGMG